MKLYALCFAMLGTIGLAAMQSHRCDSQWERWKLHSRWTPVNGCMISDNGRTWIRGRDIRPLERGE